MPIPRRFRDGTICESTLWQTPLARRHEIVPSITRYTLGRHLTGGLDELHCSVGAVEAALGEADAMAATTTVQVRIRVKSAN